MICLNSAYGCRNLFFFSSHFPTHSMGWTKKMKIECILKPIYGAVTTAIANWNVTWRRNNKITWYSIFHGAFVLFFFRKFEIPIYCFAQWFNIDKYTMIVVQCLDQICIVDRYLVHWMCLVFDSLRLPLFMQISVNLWIHFIYAFNHACKLIIRILLLSVFSFFPISFKSSLTFTS